MAGARKLQRSKRSEVSAPTDPPRNGSSSSSASRAARVIREGQASSWPSTLGLVGCVGGRVRRYAVFSDPRAPNSYACPRSAAGSETQSPPSQRSVRDCARPVRDRGASGTRGSRRTPRTGGGELRPIGEFGEHRHPGVRDESVAARSDIYRFETRRRLTFKVSLLGNAGFDDPPPSGPGAGNLLRLERLSADRS